jgi:hypothetical protein
MKERKKKIQGEGGRREAVKVCKYQGFKTS